MAQARDTHDTDTTFGRASRSCGEGRPSPALGRQWLVTAAVALCVLVGWEVFWRARGFRGQLDDGPMRWAVMRKRATRPGSMSLIMVGASRIRCGVDGPTFECETGMRPVRLGIGATRNVMVLEHLAADPDVTGIVIYSCTAGRIAAGDESKPAEHIARHDSLGAFEAWRYARGEPLKRLVLWGGRVPERKQRWILPDRTMRWDFQTPDLPALRARADKRWAAMIADARPIPMATFLAGAERVRVAVEKIQARGGLVILVRFPTNGPCWEWSETETPRADYWDRLADLTGADEVLHFQDDPRLASFECPDYSHMDYRDAPAFTSALVSALRLRTPYGEGYPAGNDGPARESGRGR